MTRPDHPSAGSDAAAIEAKAAALRAQWLEQQRTGRLADHVSMDHLHRARDVAREGAANADKSAKQYLDNAKATMKAADDYDAKAKQLEAKDPAEAQEYRELAAQSRAEAQEITGLANAAQSEADQFRTDADRLDKEYQSASDVGVKHMNALDNAEIQIDHLEQKAASLRQADQAREYADQADKDAVRMRAEGNDKGADLAVARAAKHRTDADNAQAAADAKVVDETAFAAANLNVPVEPGDSQPGVPTEGAEGPTESAEASDTSAASPPVVDQGDAGAGDTQAEDGNTQPQQAEETTDPATGDANTNPDQVGDEAGSADSNPQPEAAETQGEAGSQPEEAEGSTDAEASSDPGPVTGDPNAGTDQVGDEAGSADGNPQPEEAENQGEAGSQPEAAEGSTDAEAPSEADLQADGAGSVDTDSQDGAMDDTSGYDDGSDGNDTSGYDANGYDTSDYDDGSGGNDTSGYDTSGYDDGSVGAEVGADDF
jgi:hypothetical protein